MALTTVSRTAAIKRFLEAKAPSDLASLYNHDMEVQVNVAEDGGERIEGEYKGKRWGGYTDGTERWKSYRIPYNANTKPEYEDSAQTFNLEKHVEGIGMTGWDWVTRVSRWVAFDFDAITGHSDKHTRKLTDTELKEVRDKISEIPWTTVRTSTSGSGLHVYVFLDPPVPTQTHTEHAAVGRSILGLMTALTGVELSAKVDACGQNMWVWHRKMLGTNGLQVIKKGTPLTRVPVNWKDHLSVVSNKRKRVLPEFIASSGGMDGERYFEELSGQRNLLKLDEQHLKLIEYLNSDENKYFFAFDQDNNMITTHTVALREAHKKLGFRGIYNTVSEGTETEQNCFAFPMRNGGWVVRRFTQNIAEAPTWDVDRAGWTRCYYNVMPELKTAAFANGGVENIKGGYVFRGAKLALQAARSLGSVPDLPTEFEHRQITLKEHNDGRLLIEVEKTPSDSTSSIDFTGWVDNRRSWTRIINAQTKNKQETEVANYDDVIRHITDIENNDAGWVLCTNSIWRSEPLTHIQKYLVTHGLDKKEIDLIVGSSIAKCWTIVNRPFQPEYPGDRQWNRDAVQLRFAPSDYSDNLFHPTWNRLLDHVGDSLTPYTQEHKWCKANGILTGGQYLKCWVASAIQEPEEPLPYLFFWSKEQKTGKTTFHEALELLLTKGVVRADLVLDPKTQHNAELEDGIFCVIEEKEFSGSGSKQVYNRLKDLITSRTILIHKKYMTPYKAKNTTHWIHCANEQDAAPIYPGDTRIISIYVPPIPEDQLIPGDELMNMLRKEAPDFISGLLHLELPEHRDRFNLPVIETEDKTEVATSNESPLDTFIRDFCFNVPGAAIQFSEFYNSFALWLGEDSNLVKYWNKNRVGRDLDKVKFPRGKLPGLNDVFVGNLTLVKDVPPKASFVGIDGKLVAVNDQPK